MSSLVIMQGLQQLGARAVPEPVAYLPVNPAPLTGLPCLAPEGEYAPGTTAT